MKAFRISTKTVWGNEERIAIAEKIEDLFLDETETAEELCEVIYGCSGADIPYFIKDKEELTYGDYILENGLIIGDETHSDEGKVIGDIDIPRTNRLMKKNGDCDFADWYFDLWVGSYWNGNNWRVVCVRKD